MTPEELKLLAGSIEGLCSIQDCEILYSLARDLDVSGAILEIGGFKGRITVCLAKALEEKGDGRAYTIDANLFGTKNSFLSNIDRFGVGGRVEPIFAHSAVANVNWQCPLKFIWIDTDGNYFSLKCDFILWEPYLVKGGVLAFGCANSSSVKRFVKDYLEGSKRFSSVVFVGSVVYAYKQNDTPVYPKVKIKYIRQLYLTHFRIKKMLYYFFRVFYPGGAGRDFALKKTINHFFEKVT